MAGARRFGDRAGMARALLGLVLFLACARPPAPGAPGAPVASGAPVAPRPADVDSVDGMIRAFYEVVSVGPDEPRQWDRDRTLYVPWIRFVAIDGEGKIVVYTHPEFVTATEPLLQAGFREHEVSRTTRRYGNMVHVDSTYEAQRGRDKLERSRGVNSIDLYWDGHRWWIASVVWQSESARFPIPATLLPAAPP
jgi:hypothetical protein